MFGSFSPEPALPTEFPALALMFLRIDRQEPGELRDLGKAYERYDSGTMISWRINSIPSSAIAVVPAGSRFSFLHAGAHRGL